MAFVLYLLYLCGIIKKMFSEVLLLIFTQNLESNNGECFNYGRKRFYRKFHRRGSVETKVWCVGRDSFYEYKEIFEKPEDSFSGTGLCAS